MIKWIRKYLCPQESKDDTREADPDTLLSPPEDTEAQIVVVYNILKGSGFSSLQCKVESRAEFIKDDTPDELKQIANTAVRILTDQGNIELIYTSVMNNMLHVPTKLRDNPN